MGYGNGVMGMMDKGYGIWSLGIEYYSQMCIGDGFIFN